MKAAAIVAGLVLLALIIIKRAGARGGLVRLSWLSLALPTGAAGGFALSVAYAQLAGISLTAKGALYGQTVHIVMLSVALIVGFISGMSAGGWVWSRLAKRFMTKKDFESFLVDPTSSSFVNQNNRQAIDKLFKDPK